MVQGASLAGVQGKAASQTPPPVEARVKSLTAPAPRAGDDAVSPDGYTDPSSCGAVGAPPGERAKKGITDLRAVHLIRAIYTRHRKHKSESRTIRPASKQKEK